MPYPYYEYEIGLAAGVRDNVESLVSCVPSPESKLPDYSIYRDSGDGDEVADGHLQCTWHFDILLQDDLNTLEAYITGQSSVVHIRTKTRAGAYTCYQAFMHRPKIDAESKRIIGGWTDVVFRFTHMASEACT